MRSYNQNMRVIFLNLSLELKPKPNLNYLIRRKVFIKRSGSLGLGGSLKFKK